MRRAVVALLPMLVLSGCSNPYDQPRAADVGGERRDETPVPDARARVAEPTVGRLVRRAVDLTGNWTGTTVARRYELLARISVGDARRQALDTAARIPTDHLLSRADSVSSVVLDGVVRRGRTIFVVTRETLTAGGVRSKRYRVTRATIRRAHGGWVLATWEPQP